MKITKEQLKQLLKEEIQSVFSEGDSDEVLAAISNVPKAAQAIAAKVKGEIEGLSEKSGLDPLVLAQAVAALLTSD
jgi:hypothetical protein|tara:strand:+ start:2000 stop:2227 length:228 start_codon:yes stop_codon:yes gene_type:complete